MIERVWLILPPPHDLVQVDQALHMEIWQSTAQAWVLHAEVAVMAGQAAPPNAMEVCTTRARVSVPPPQACEQTPRSTQALTSQSTGHLCVLHWRDSESMGQALPP